MPVFAASSLEGRPGWVAPGLIESFYLDPLGAAAPSHRRMIPRAGTGRELVIVVAGSLFARTPRADAKLETGGWIEVEDAGVELDAAGAAAPRNQAKVLRIAGHWDATPDLGLFWVHPDQPLEIHYHDFDEYWVILHGRSPAVIDGAPGAVSPGQLIATAAGYEHGIPQPDGELVGLSFCLERPAAARPGHLHRDVEGPPVPSRPVPTTPGGSTEP